MAEQKQLGITKGRAILPPRIVLHGKHKIGKTTFAAGAPGAIFLPTEDGADEVGVDRFPRLESWQDFAQALAQIGQDMHDYRVVVVDSGDWLERLIHAKVCKDKGVKSLEEIPYGKGYAFALDVWRRVLDGLDICRARGMAVVLICHSQIKRFDSPESEPFDRYVLKLHDKASALVSEWCDAILFATDDVVIKKADVGFNNEIARGVSTGRRSLRCVERPAYIAGNRYGLPDSIPFPREDAWGSFVDEIERAQSKASAKTIARNGSDTAGAEKEEVQHGAG